MGREVGVASELVAVEGGGSQDKQRHGVSRCTAKRPHCQREFFFFVQS